MRCRARLARHSRESDTPALPPARERREELATPSRQLSGHRRRRSLGSARGWRLKIRFIRQAPHHVTRRLGADFRQVDILRRFDDSPALEFPPSRYLLSRRAQPYFSTIASQPPRWPTRATGIDALITACRCRMALGPADYWRATTETMLSSPHAHWFVYSPAVMANFAPLILPALGSSSRR